MATDPVRIGESAGQVLWTPQSAASRHREDQQCPAPTPTPTRPSSSRTWRPRSHPRRLPRRSAPQAAVHDGVLRRAPGPALHRGAAPRGRRADESGALAGPAVPAGQHRVREPARDGSSSTSPRTSATTGAPSARPSTSSRSATSSAGRQRARTPVHHRRPPRARVPRQGRAAGRGAARALGGRAHARSAPSAAGGVATGLSFRLWPEQWTTTPGPGGPVWATRAGPGSAVSRRAARVRQNPPRTTYGAP